MRFGGQSRGGELLRTRRGPGAKESSFFGTHLEGSTGKCFPPGGKHLPVVNSSTSRFLQRGIGVFLRVLEFSFRGGPPKVPLPASPPLPNWKCDSEQWVSMPMVAQGQAKLGSAQQEPGKPSSPHAHRVLLKVRSSTSRSTWHTTVTIVARRHVEARARRRASQQRPSSAPVPGRQRPSRAALHNLKNERTTAGAGSGSSPRLLN